MKNLKTKLFVMLVGLLSILGFSTNVNAEEVPAGFETYWLKLIETEYIPGLKNYHKFLRDGVEVYCEQEGLKYYSLKQYHLIGRVDDGFIYIIENRPNTGNTQRDYYVISAAVWWYKDILSGNDHNIPADKKQYIIQHKDTDAVCKMIYDLVEGAKKYKQTAGYINIVTDPSFKFTEIDGYYISDKITLSSKIDNFKGITIENMPSGTQIINNNVNNKGNGSFQIKVPKSSVAAGSFAKFTVKVNGTYNYKSAYEYGYTDPAFQNVIYGKVFVEPKEVSNSLNLAIVREKNHNKLTINKVDKSNKALSGAELTLYKGNCVNTTCTDANKVESWTTTSSAKVFNDIAVGNYTLVETKAPNGYRIADKMLINVDSDSKTYTYTMIDVEYSEVRISKTDVTKQNEIPGAHLVLKDESGKVIDEWTSTTTSHYVKLDTGVYTLIETIAPNGYILNRSTITFKVDKDNNIYELVDGKYVKTDYIKMINYAKDAVSINKLDSDTNEFVSGAKLVVKNNKGEQVAAWTTTKESYYISLDEGEYTLEEVEAPKGYVLNTTPISFKIDENGKLFIKNNNGEYVSENGVIMYNKPEEVIVVPPTGLSSTLTYVVGSLVILGGAIALYRNEKKC